MSKNFKRALIALLVVAVILVAAVFHTMQKKEDVQDQKQQQVDSTELIQTEGIDYDTVKREMSNHNSEGVFAIWKDWVYFTDFDADSGNGRLVRSHLDGKDYQVLVQDCDPTYITFKDDVLYAVLWYRDLGPALVSMAPDGKGETTLIEDAMDVQIVGDEIYYNLGEGEDYEFNNVAFYRCNLDGTESEAIMVKTTYDNFVAGDLVYYVDAKDEKVHVYEMETEKDALVTEDRAMRFVTDGTYGYYLVRPEDDEAETTSLVRIDLKSKETKVLAEEVSVDVLLVEGDKVYFGDPSADNRIKSVDKDGSGSFTVIEDTNVRYLCCQNNKLMYFDFDKNGEYVDHLYICNIDGSKKNRLDKS